MDICHKDTKNRENLDKLYKKAKSKKQKKRASSPEPLASCKKSQKAFLFLLTSNCYPKINLSFYL